MLMNRVMSWVVLALTVGYLTGCGVPQEAPSPLPRVTALADVDALAAPAIFLDLGGQGTNAFTNGTANFGRVAKLSLRGIPMAALPALLQQCASLVWLDAGECGLTSLDAAMSALPGVQTLYLSDNKLASLPEEIAFMPALRYLNLDRNVLTQLPSAVGSLVELRWLRLNRNRLSALPEQLGSLPQLERLYARHNALTSVPASLLESASLKGLFLEGNPIAPEEQARIKAALPECDVRF
jgi:Leucine-rich repeat (LRR) protein